MLLLLGAALAQEAVTPPEPIPLAGEPRAAEALAYALLPGGGEYLTDDAEWRSCAVRVSLHADGGFEPTLADCPDAMAVDALRATLQWRFAPGEGDTTLTITYHLRYSATLAVTTLHAEVDPGPEGEGLQGPPGVKLVRPPTLLKPVKAKVPKAAKKAGVTGGDCTLRAKVDVEGHVQALNVVSCPEGLAVDAMSRGADSRWRAATIDGLPVAAEADLVLRY